MQNSTTKFLSIMMASVVLFFMLTLAGDNVEYLSIVTERSSVAKYVNTGRLDFDTLKADYENCIYRMQRLKEKSDYGYLLSSIDSMNAGRMISGLLIFLQIVITAIAILILGVALEAKLRKEYKRAKRMVRRANARRKRSGKYAATAKRVKAHPRGGKYAA